MVGSGSGPEPVRGGVSRNELIFDWNGLEAAGPFSPRPFELADETLAGALLAPAAVDASVDEKLALLRHAAACRITCADLGPPGPSEQRFADLDRLLRAILRERLALAAAVSIRPSEAEVALAASLQDKAGAPLVAHIALATSPIRRYAEDEDLDALLNRLGAACAAAQRAGLTVSVVAEDALRSHPAALARTFMVAIERGARSLVLADSTGHATPEAARRLVAWTRDLILGTGYGVRVEWRGNNDRGLALINAIAAVRAGAECAHASALGLGERAGGTPMEQLLVNLGMMRAWPRELPELGAYVRTAARAFGVSVAPGQPLAGAHAFHVSDAEAARSLVRAHALEDEWLFANLCTAAPASQLGREPRLAIGPGAGAEAVRHVLLDSGLAAPDAVCARIVEVARHSDHVLGILEVRELAERFARGDDAGEEEEPVRVEVTP